MRFAVLQNNPRSKVGIFVGFIVFLFGLAWSWPRVVFAQTQDSAAARMLFQEARKAVSANDYATACPKFAESYRLDPAVGTLLNLADCDQRQGRISTAWSNFQKGLDQLPKNDERRAAVQRVVSELDKRLPRLTVALKSGSPPETRVERDGVTVGDAGLGIAIPVDPGRHVLVIKAPGRKDNRYEFELREAESRQLLGEPGPFEPEPVAVPSDSPGPPALELAAPPPPPAAPQMTPQPVASPHSEMRRKSRTVAYVVGGSGIVGIAVGVVTRVVALGKQSTIDNHCPSKACDATGWDEISSAKTLQTVSTLSLIAGTAAVGVGVYLGVSAGDSQESLHATLHPMVVPGGGGVTLLRRF